MCLNLFTHPRIQLHTAMNYHTHTHTHTRLQAFRSVNVYRHPPTHTHTNPYITTHIHPCTILLFTQMLETDQSSWPDHRFLRSDQFSDKLDQTVIWKQNKAKCASNSWRQRVDQHPKSGSTQMCPQYLKLHTTLSVSQSVSQTVPSSLNFVAVPNHNHPSSLTVIMIIMDISMVDHFTLIHPQKQGGLLGTGGKGMKEWRLDWGYCLKKTGETVDTAPKRPERPWTTARTMEMLRPVSYTHLTLPTRRWV